MLDNLFLLDTLALFDREKKEKKTTRTSKYSKKDTVAVVVVDDDDDEAYHIFFFNIVKTLYSEVFTYFIRKKK